SLRREYRRKVRTMARGLETLFYKRHLLNPLRYGSFSWMLASHKLARWLVFLAIPPAVLALAHLSLTSPVALALFLVFLGGLVLGLIALRMPDGAALPRLVRLCGFLLVSHTAGVVAWTKALRGELNPIWEPTRRSA
ncbi:MAG TPA: hypothetical protein VNH46_08250, partial [Gemmatimonadales bacterium]|nr:hypothetical protein [Gemmatimonadales bacterium]